MAKGYVVMSTVMHQVIGLIESKEMRDLFVQQRGDRLYYIEKCTNKKVMDVFIDLDMTASDFYGWIMFPDEIEYAMGWYEQWMMTYEHYLGEMIRDYLDVLKLEPAEYKILEAFLVVAAKQIREYNILLEEEPDFMEVEDTFFHMTKFAEDAIF